MEANEHQKIVRRLEAADRVAQKERGASRLLRWLPWLLLLPVLFFLADVLFHLEAVPRLILLVVFGLAVIVWAGLSWHAAFIRRNRLEHVARLIEQHDERLGSRLINFLQLRDQTEDPNLTPLTKQLARAAVEQAAANFDNVSFDQRARSGLMPRAWKIALGGVGVFAILLLVFQSVTRVEIARFLDPFGDHPPYSFTRLAITEPAEDGTPVIYNRALLFRAGYTGHRPGELFLTFHPPDNPEQSETVPMFDKGELGFDQQIEGIKTDLLVFAHTRDHRSVSQKRRVTVRLTPQLEKVVLKITPPAYTGLPVSEQPWSFKNFRALAGSQIEIRMQSNRPLKEGLAHVIYSSESGATNRMQPVSGNEVAVTFEATESARMRFSLTDVEGIVSDETWESSVTVTYDLGPEITITSPDKDTFAAIDFPVDVRIDAADDYGLSQVRIHRGLNGVFFAPKQVVYEGIQRGVQEVLRFDFRELGVRPGDVLSIFAEAIDNAPEPHLARSETRNLIVISVDDYNDYLRRERDLNDLSGKYAELMDKLRDKIEAQRELADKARALKEQMENSVTPEAKRVLQQELDQLLAKQSDLNQQLNKQADQFENFVRDNPLYDVEKDFQTQLDDLAQRIRESTEQNDQEMQALAQRSETSPPGAMLDSFSESARDQMQRLGGVQEQARDGVMEPLEEMATLQELMKDFNRFEALYQAQIQLADQLAAYNRAGTLSREDQLAMKQLADTQRRVREELGLLSEKLERDAGRADEHFPKAAQSARDLAAAIQDQRMPELAGTAMRAMLAGEGEQSHQVASRLRDEMEKLFSQCQSQGGPAMNRELDQYLKLSRGMNPGRNFQQMMQCMKMGYGSGSGFGFGLGQMGLAGSSGGAVQTGMNMNIMGGESLVSSSTAAERGSQAGSAEERAGALADGNGLQFDKTGVMEGLNTVQRMTDAVKSESMFEQYGDIVDQYFKTITTKP